ncbi:MAG: sugar phosphate isomerase/epimerase [Caldilineales bacterium]|nr:sugar phosphate isomerase/epimerase [Caldilineales bacterium]
MRIGVNVWVWTAPITTEAFKTLAPKVRDIGFDFVEIPLESIGDMNHKECGVIAADLGLGVSTVAAMGPDRDLIHPDPAIRANGMEYVRQSVKATQDLGGVNFVGPLYSAVGRTWQIDAAERARLTDLLVANLSDLAEFAGDRGVTLCVEPLNRFETSFMNLASQAIEVVDRVDNPACGILLDTFHMNIEEKSAGEAIRAAGPRLKHLHSCENDRGAPGSGNVAWDEVARALRDIEYDGPVVIESFTAQVQSIAKAAAIWRPLARSQDALAEDGYKFLSMLLG